MQRSFASVTLFVGGASSQETKLLHTWECYTWECYTAVFFSKVWFKVSLPSVESVWFLIHNSMSSQGGSMLWSAFLLKKIPEVTHLWMFTPHLYRYTYFDHGLSQRSIVMCQSPSVLCEPLFDYTWESSKTLHKVPSMLAACKSRTNKCSNFARCRQSGREHVDMFSNSIRCMDCMDHILGTQKKKMFHCPCVRHKT